MTSHRAVRKPWRRSKWVEAELLELKQLRENGTWKVVGRKPIGCRWTYAKKTDAQGNVVRFKARLVCKGFSQVEGVDYHETYSPVVKMTTVRVLTALIAARDFHAQQPDADTAFVQAMLRKDLSIYVNQSRI
ncbi:hypothetical protein AaE_013081 [Aphanomyces astaci]|uniref:Reverse transcriptase Ty1/copia-type domain-containing protein n=1 Tax=Aphanomyces astaci TaxID=112090 RepID=A0A6A4ZC34_APHAT|nr:hypothetical protein AaE_013081 [Aphanomyces astaci]